MRLGLSSAAAPDAGLGALLDSCTLRGLSALELCAGDGHGIALNGGGPIAIEQALDMAAAAGVQIMGYRTMTSSDATSLAVFSAALGAPVIVADECGINESSERARRIVGDGGSALVLARGRAADWQDAITGSSVNYAWEVDASCGDLAEDIELVLHRSESGLQYIRFIGGGPEASLQEGRGIGTLMGRLALVRYDGPLILAPSSTHYRFAWESWLGRRGGWGCGGKAADDSLVSLPLHSVAGGRQ